MTALKTASVAANNEFDAYLERHNAGATMSVPDSVIESAQAAFAKAGGKGEIVVRGIGNPTHPVCSVEVRRVKSRR
jgi:hypothetical protein